MKTQALVRKRTLKKREINRKRREEFEGFCRSLGFCQGVTDDETPYETTLPSNTATLPPISAVSAMSVTRIAKRQTPSPERQQAGSSDHLAINRTLRISRNSYAE